MKKLVFSCLAMIMFSCWSFAQNEEDALRYSQMFYSGTARSMSMGQAFGALGGDISSLSINPAGLGVYRKSEFTFTPTLLYNTSKSAYLGTDYEDFKYQFGLSSIGIAGAFNTGHDHGWISTNLAFGYNRMNNFDYNTTIKTYNSPNSYADQIVSNANNNLSWKNDTTFYFNNDPVSQIAFDNHLISMNDSTKKLFSNFTGVNNEQRRTIETSGYSGEYVFSVASNYDNVLFVGGTVGIQTVDYKEHFNHYESVLSDVTNTLNSFTYSQDLHTTGTGYNIKLGAIVKPYDWLRLGLAFHSPTFFDLHDRYYYEISSDLPNNGGAFRYNGEYDYKLSTPPRGIASLGLVAGKIAILSFDYEVVDYTAMRLRGGSDGYDFDSENSDIQSHFTTAHNFRSGAELRFGQISLRGGFAYYGSPYSSDQANKNADMTQLSGGFGINNNDFFMDFGYVHSFNSSKYYMYQLVDQPATIDYSSNKILVTLGFRF